MEQHLELESLGILRQTKVPPELSWMSDEQKQFMLLVLFGAEAGLHKSQVTKFEKKSPDVVFQLSIRNLVEWQTDKQGRAAYIALTWQGDEVAQLLCHIARHASRGPVSHKLQR